MSLILSGDTGVSSIDGTAALPAFVGNDANTGIYFPAADRIGFSEGGAQCGEFDASANFKFNSGYGSVATGYGCRAWVNFNGTGTPAIRGNGNVSSITDVGTGQYSINFTTAMPDINYATNITLAGGNAYIGTISSQTTALVTISTWDTSSAFFDSTIVAVSVFR